MQEMKVGKSPTQKLHLLSEHIVGFAPELLDGFDNHLSAAEEVKEANAQTAEERMDYYGEFENETMIAEEVRNNLHFY